MYFPTLLARTLLSHKPSPFLDDAIVLTLFCDFFHLAISTSLSPLDSLYLDQPPPPQQPCSPLQPPPPKQPLPPPSIFQLGSPYLLSCLRLAILTSSSPPSSLHLTIFTLLSTLQNIPEIKGPSLKEEVVQ